MKAEDIRALSEDQVTDELLKLKKEQFNLRFQDATGQLEKTARVRQVRRDIARIKTIQGEKNPLRRKRRKLCLNVSFKVSSFPIKRTRRSLLKSSVLFCTRC